MNLKMLNEKVMIVVDTPVHREHVVIHVPREPEPPKPKEPEKPK